jgi:outer membrane protein TolC
VPIFDFGEVRVREAREAYMGAVNRLTEKAVNARSEAREAYAAYRSSYDIALHYRDEVLPLRKLITEETMLRYGAMQIDVFGLLAEARQRLAANVAAITNGISGLQVPILVLRLPAGGARQRKCAQHGGE